MLTEATLQAIHAAAETAVAPRAALPVFDHEKLDALERIALAQPAALLFPDYEHLFVPNLYARTIKLPQVPGGYIHTTKIHASEHVWTCRRGAIWVSGPDGVRLVEAGEQGVTKPGTRRVLWNLVECHWTTYHPLSPEEESMRQAGVPQDEIIAAVERRIIEWRELDNGMSAFEMFTSNPEIRAAAQAAGLPVANLRAALPEGGS